MSEAAPAVAEGRERRESATAAGEQIEPIRTPYRLTVVIPAYNEAAAIGGVLARVGALLPEAELLVVDDGSADDTAALAEAAGARVVRQPYNKGNGAAVKAGLRAARGEVVLLLDADGQHDPADIAHILAPLGPYDMAIGARTRRSNANAARGWGNWALNRLASYLTGMEIADLTSGFRAMKRDHIMEFIHLLPNQYSYPMTSTLAFIKAGYSVQFVPIEARKRSGGHSAQKVWQNGVKFCLIILRMVTLFSPMKIFLPISALLFLVGAAYAVYTAITQIHITNSSTLLIVTSIVIFLMGLISEQIAALRFERMTNGE
ncbi:MAG TPA: glycosyltransferase family 2 protein [Thermomicrobiales bacterium]|nr:glycosyltransferase family 2 protein [Thermomicrobiales bacterium]